MPDRRWEEDANDQGIGSAEELLPPLLRLEEAMRNQTWVAEQPEYHLLPHLEAWCDRDGSPWRLISSRSEEALFVVELEWRGGKYRRELTQEAYTLLGRIAEANTHVREESDGDYTVFDVTTGMLDGDGRFAAHGHTLRLRIHRKAG